MSKRGRNFQVERIFNILTLLELHSKGMTVHEICEAIAERGYEVAKRTVYRDLTALSSAGFPVYSDNGDREDFTRAIWKIEQNAKVGNYLILSVKELLALYFARNILEPLRGTVIHEDIKKLFKKIEDRIGSKNRTYFHELSSEIRFEPSPGWGLQLDPEVLETVRACCAEGNVLEVVYDSVNSGKKTKRVIGPHYLYFARGSMYLLGEDLHSKAIKVFALPRMQDAKMLSDAYTAPRVDPEKYFSEAFGVYHSKNVETVVLMFSPAVASYVRERRWHGSQKILSKLGDTYLKFELRLGLTPELTQWVLGFGANVEVLEPQALRTEVQKAAEQVSNLYSKKIKKAA